MAGYYSGRRRLYRSRDGALLGVCRGIAEWRDLPVDMVRLVFVLLVLFGGMTIWIYFILALIIPMEPADGFDRSESRRRRTQSSDYDSAQAEFDDLKQRVRRMEDEEFDKERDWDNRFSKGR